MANIESQIELDGLREDFDNLLGIYDYGDEVITDKVFIFPGTTDHISIPSVNGLDADTGHLEQSAGYWVGGMLGNDSTVPFGTKSIQVTLTAGSGELTVLSAFGTAPDGIISVDPLTEYSIGVWVKSEIAGGGDPASLRLILREYRSIGGFYSIVLTGYASIQVDEWVYLSSVRTTSPDASGFGLELKINNDRADGDKVAVGAACIREGSDPTFVSSLNIVGTLGETVDPLDMPIVYTPGAPLTVGAGWAGDGYRYTRYDGPEGVGPVVAYMSSTDTNIAFGEGSIPDGSTWIGTDDDRIWKVNGSGIDYTFIYEPAINTDAAKTVITITRILSRGDMNATTGKYDDPVISTIYSGPAHVSPVTYRRDRQELGGMESIRIRQYRAVVPWDSGDIWIDDKLTVSFSQDPQMVGKVFDISDVLYESELAARRLSLTDTSKDGEGEGVC